MVRKTGWEMFANKQKDVCEYDARYENTIIISYSAKSHATAAATVKTRLRAISVFASQALFKQRLLYITR